MKTKRARAKYVTIVIRGCQMRVAASKARELQRLESINIQHDWLKNSID